VITVNGELSELCAGETLADVLARLGLDASARGVAIAVDGEVVPKRQWTAYELAEHARVEVLGAMQGG
jgi:sulfur carrier protein